ncbi:MAG: GPP34 family phosphoprotein [Candidatus Cloacimonetes bacterium]|nr:GPP34 family phosphoprotein [Candidatus Cloacimonadota bacterium]
MENNGLTFAEELFLLALDDEKGVLIEMPVMALEYGLVGGLLMELALMNRIDTDLEKLILLDNSPTGDELYDKILEIVGTFSQDKSTSFWIKQIARDFTELKGEILKRLIEKKILKQEEHKILWVFSKRCYPMINFKQEKEVKTRIRDMVTSEDIPEYRDIMLLALTNSCGLLDQVFKAGELEKYQERIENLSRFDLIGQAVNKAVSDIHKLISAAVAYVIVGPPA